MTVHHWTNGNLSMVQYLCEQWADKDARDEDGRTPLLRAAENDYFALGQYLREQGADEQST